MFRAVTSGSPRQEALVGSPRAPRSDCRQLVAKCSFLTMYSEAPDRVLSIFDLEALIMKRMELLACVDLCRNSPMINGSSELITAVQKLLHGEDFKHVGKANAASEDAPKSVLDAGVYLDRSGRSGSFSFSAEDDALSHLCCRLVFCQSDVWREWFVKNEELILRARFQKLFGNATAQDLRDLFTANSIPFDDCRLDELPSTARAFLDSQLQYCKVPISHALKAIRSRSCVVIAGSAIVPLQTVVDGYLAEYRRRLFRGLHDAQFVRQRHLSSGTDAALANTMQMLDSFFQRFIVNPNLDTVAAPGDELTANDIAAASSHFPLCMRRTDRHLRKEHHLKHHGRWAYGLFLKGIGLSLDESIKLFGSLLTLKASKDFPKSSYAYNIRHMYGKEGKRTSYSSLTCASIIAQPPNVDKFDCHGCPFRFKDEGSLRALLQQPIPGPNGEIKLTTHDIEDLMQDSKDMHYTRACFKHFMATHPGLPVHRDSLFRGPTEYYATSVEAWKNAPTANSKRDRDEITPTRTVVKPRGEQP
jgi:DNA primase large subunit